MNKEDLANHIAQKHNISKAKASRILGTLADSIMEEVAKGNDVRLRGLGTFKAVYRKAKKGRNIDSGDVIEIPPKIGVKFSTGTKFTEVVNDGPMSNLLQ